MPRRVDQGKQTALDATDQFAANFAVAESVVLSNDSIRVGQRKCCVGEIKTSHPVARPAFILVLLEVHELSLAQ